MTIQRRTWGEWQYYTSHPATLGNRMNGSVYHIKLSALNTPEGRLMWLNQISEKPMGDNTGLRLAIATLLDEGVISE